ncbi:MAG TPA: tetratricopeptide repeat protein [Pyrinomonadaceae bacterium]|jgi:tetratricopeptide (TPR) repeat protein|nr:tetratricopeptide repeat protein [Pyrinomonadaceae bacterium]
MIGRYFFGVLMVAILLAFASMTAVAQVGELRGHVWMQQADGQKVPLADAQIDVFRTDISAKYNTKTSKKGEFVFAGLPFIGTYIVAASHPTAKPTYVNGVKAGRDIPVELTLTPGDGKRLTFDEIKAGGGGSANPPAASGGGGKPSGESAADKAKREEIEKKNLEIEAKNKKITESNEIIARTFKTGNEALTAAGASAKAGNSEEAITKYTAAIAQYDEGLAADADQPAILTNKAVALKGRGVERFNSAVRSKTLDDAGKAALLGTAKDDFKAAAETSSKAVTLIKAQPVPTEAAELQRYNGNKYAAMLTNAESMRLYVSKADQSQADAGLAAFRDYIGIETDPAKKAKAQLDMAQMLLDSGQADKALTEFKAILAATPDSPEANLGAGLAVYALGDKTKYQEAANFLQRFVEVAPDSNPMKDDAKAILTELKNTENVTPEKGTKPARKRP